MEHPKVSVVIPAYNHERYVGEAIRSVLSQTFRDFELIIINDGSTDRTEEEIKRWKDERIRYAVQENRGLSATLNRGIESARGEYFNFLPSDDAFYPEKLEVQLGLLEQHPELGVVFSYPRLVDAQGREILDDPAAQWPIVPFETKEEIFPALFERNFLSAPTALIRMECLRKVGFFDESLKYAQDYDLWMRILKYYDARLIKRYLVKYRWHGGNLTFQGTPETESERAIVLLKAYKDLGIDDLFPGLAAGISPLSYAEAYQKLAGHMERSGVPALRPIAEMLQNQGMALRSPFSDLPVRIKRENGGESRIPGSGKMGGKIHLLIETISLDQGGLEQVVFNLAKGLDRTFFRIFVVVIEKGGFFSKRCKEIGVPVEILEHDKAREYREILERYRIDIVLSHYSTFGTKCAFEKGIPTLSVLHNLYSWFPDNILSDFKSADPLVSGYIAVSEEVRQYAHYRFHIPLEKMIVIPNGIDIEEYLSRPEARGITRSELGLEKEDYVLINVASVGPPKGQNVILAALGEVVREIPQIKVLSVGGVLDEAYAQFLKGRIQELQLSSHFKWIGPVEDVRPYLQIADAFLLTSLIEGWPLSVMEAMLHRLPVITTRVGGVSEILGNGEGGLLLNNGYDDFRQLDVPSLDKLSREVSPRNTEEVVRAMKRFWDEKGFAKELGKSGYERILKHFTLQAMARSYEKELFTLFISAEKSRANRRLRMIQEQERLLSEKEKTIGDLGAQITQIQERFDSMTALLTSKVDLFASRVDSRHQTIERQLEYILIRLSLKERMKGLLYPLLKKIHQLVPVPVRERYRNVYRRVFYDSVTPADQRLFRNQYVSTPKESGPASGGEASSIQPVKRSPIQDFLAFKEEMRRGVTLEAGRFGTDHVPGLVSVILPVYNQAYLLGGAIESVLRQTYPDFELIIVNDGSTDGIEAVLGPYRSHANIRIIDQENQKLPGALSHGFQFARGEYFTWTSADNLMDPRQIAVQVEFLKRNPQVQMVYTNYDIIDDHGEPVLNSDYCPKYQVPPGSNHIHLPRDLSEFNVIRNNFIGPSFLYRSWVGRLIGDYDASMFTVEDYDYWMTVNTFFKIEHLGQDEPFYLNRVHDDSLTGRKKELKIVEITDRLMEFEKTRRDFYREKFHVYLLGNNGRLREVRTGLEANGNRVEEFRIPSKPIGMERGKSIGIWAASSVEEGFVLRVIRENPHAFFALIQLDQGEGVREEVLRDFGMRASVPGKLAEKGGRGGWFHGDSLPSLLYPILCKAHIELFRKRDDFRRWIP